MSQLFDLDTLAAIARKGIDRPHDEMVSSIVDATAGAWPGHIDASPRRRWLFSLTAGAVGVMTLLHASCTEYLIIFGSPIGTEGFSGRYRMEIHDFVLAGEVWTYQAEACAERRVFRPGDHLVLERGQVGAFRIPEMAWLLEYGRGCVPAAFPLILGDVIFSAADGTTLVETIWRYGTMALRELLIHGKF